MLLQAAGFSRFPASLDELVQNVNQKLSQSQRLVLDDDPDNVFTGEATDSEI